MLDAARLAGTAVLGGLSSAARLSESGSPVGGTLPDLRGASSSSAGMPAEDDEAPLKSGSVPPTGEPDSESLAAEDKPPSTAVPASRAASSTASPLASLLLLPR